MYIHRLILGEGMREHCQGICAYIERDPGFSRYPGQEAVFVPSRSHGCYSIYLVFQLGMQ
jgi:hypothetical protein